MMNTNIQTSICAFERKHSRSWVIARDKGTDMATIG